MKINWQQKRWLAIFPLIALVIVILIVAVKPSPQKRENDRYQPLVKVIKVEKHSIAPFVTGFGRAKPKEIWQALSEVNGRVIYRHPLLEQGKVINAGTVVLKIDPVDYQLKLAQAQSDVNSASAEVSRVAMEEAKLSLSLKLENQRLGILEQELKRKRGLLNSGSIAQSTVDAEQNNVWAQQQKVLDLENAVKQHPANLAVAQAKQKVAQAKLSEAQRKLAKTTITLPFDARIASVNAELEQVVGERESLISAHRIGTMEIPVQVAMTDMRQFAQYLTKPMANDEQFPDIQSWLLDAEVSLFVGNQQYVWPGKLTSVGESIDPRGNTVTLIVDVNISNEAFDPKRRPPLINDMYVQVKITGSQQSLLAVPTNALHGGKIYLLTTDGTLEVRTVDIAFESDGLTVISSGLYEGEQVILSDVIPAVPGRHLRAVAPKSAE
ncbi:acriflavin resistance protein [Thalassotalea insulae]|uniref:Acriflavin resistance protein n=1 Tax=Thalassotalea insulae TaxID=2056778 RepID=A0ABQ6GSM6_9GAMM|nr:hypothetical protein [Thalassotalea insulae]GLX78629.1 acriflavin resistance protein [Thalassotalea insulae]